MTIDFDLAGLDLDLEFSRSNIGLSCLRNKLPATKRKTNISVEHYASDLTLAMTLKFSFYPSSLRAGGVLLSQCGWSVGRVGGWAAARLAEPISL